MAPRRRFSPRDEVYLKSTSFEVYMIGGIVFLAFFTATFLLSLRINAEWMIWPGAVVAAAAGGLTLLALMRREHKRKLAELEAEQASEEQSAQ